MSAELIPPSSAGEVCLVATLNAAPSRQGDELSSLPRAVQWLEVRADLTGDIPKEWLAKFFKGRLLYTLRSVQGGGCFEGSEEQRSERLRWAAGEYDLVDLEPGDLRPNVLGSIGAEQRQISWYGKAKTEGELRRAFEALRAVEARRYRLVSLASETEDELTPLAMLRTLGRKDVAAYAEGPTGSWSRLLAPYFGSPAVFGTVEEPGPGRDGISARQLVTDYGLPALRQVTQLYGIVGGRVGRSLSPRLHNAAYRALDLPALYVPFSVPSFEDFWQTVAEGSLLTERGLRLHGFSLAAPHKEAALAAAARGSPVALRAGAANIMARSSEGWQAETADVDGVLMPLRTRGIEVRGKRAAVVGCGGSGRAAAAALDGAGAIVTVVNRTAERGRKAAEALGLSFAPLERFRPEEFAIIVNATPAGRDGGELPFTVERPGKEMVIIDFAYGANATELVTSVRSRGGIAIEGREVLYYQMRRQFQFMTGREMPVDGVAELLGFRAERVS